MCSQLSLIFEKKNNYFFLCTEIKQVTTEDFLNISKDTVLIKGKLINVMSNSINTDLHSTARLKIPGLKYLPCSMAIAAQRYCH